MPVLIPSVEEKALDFITNPEVQKKAVVNYSTHTLLRATVSNFKDFGLP